MQDINYAPDWMTEEAILTLKKGYLNEGETPYDMYRRIARTTSSYYPQGLPSVGLSQIDIFAATFEALVKGWLSPSSPVAANFGSEFGKGLPCSCYGINVENTISNIFLSSHEAAMLSKNGGGLGINLSKVIGSSKVTTWSKLFDLTAMAVSQGS